MPDLRSLFRRQIPQEQGVRIFSKNGREDLGVLLDVSQKGFRISSAKSYAPGARLSGLIETPDEAGALQFIPIEAQCMWTHRREAGFSIKEIPMAQEAAFDKLIERFVGGG
jgi:hypothetical protein